MSMAFLLTSLVVVATPGTGAIYTVAAGVSRGRRASVVAAIGCTLGVVPHMVAAITGLAAVLHTSAVAFQTLKYIGVAYLFYLAWQTWRDRSAMEVDEHTAPMSDGAVVRRAVLINVLNPKLTIFFFAFLPQFVRPGASNGWVWMAGLSLVFMVITLVVFTGYGLCASAVRAHVLSRPSVLTWMRRTFSVSYVALAGRLALEDR